MWTGRLAVPLTMALLFLVGCQARTESQSQPGQLKTAWWYDIQLQPTGNAVHGVAARDINPEWKLANVLSLEDLASRISNDDFRTFRESSSSFETAADLDNDGIAETFVVGVFASQAGEVGRFLGIFRDGMLLQHFEDKSGGSGFSTLLKVDGEVRWYKCLECGEYESVRWSGRSYVLD